MSIQSTLSNAISGLSANARAAEVVSSNVANATTEGYGRRETRLSTRELGGVVVAGIDRVVSDLLVRDRRMSDAGLGQSEVRASFHIRLEDIVGTPDDPASLTGRIAGLEAALTEAASRPDNGPRLSAVADAATGLAQQFNAISTGLREMRQDADGRINRVVQQLNASLGNVADLNRQIAVARQSGRDANNLVDLRHQEIDKISRIVPIREVARDAGAVALFTPNGAALLDGTPAKFGFTPTRIITADQSLGAPLSGLTLNGKPISLDAETGPVAGGELAALFELRDTLAPEAQLQVDALARDMIERFQAADPTVTAATGGLFTEAGSYLAPYDPLNPPSPLVEAGLADRISVNPAITQNGELWRLRDGIGAAAPSTNVGDATLILAMGDALSARRLPVAPGFTADRSASGLSADFLSFIGAGRRNAEAQQGFAASKNAALKSQEMADGVDTDHELQKLLLIEQAYAANARVISTVDDMMQQILRL